jgi:phosphoglycerate dehydrogenase-like enzyme
MQVVVVSLLPLWREELAKRLPPGVKLVMADAMSADERDAALASAEVLITVRFNAEFARKTPRVRLIVCPAAGTEEIDRALLPAGVELVSGGGQEIPIAEHVLGGLIALRHRFFESDRKLRAGEWAYGYHRPRAYIEELHHARLGIIGYGRIGKEIARLAEAFGMHWHAVTLHPEKAASARVRALADPAAVDALVRESDAIAICCELSPITRGLLDARRLGLMKPTAVLVNVARGAIAVERDLYEALKARRIAGAALDVWYKYPKAPDDKVLPSEFPFWELDNVIMTPHCSGWTEPARDRKLAQIAAVITNFARSA